MKLQRTTWILIAIALLLGGTTYVYVVREETQEQQSQQQQPVFEFGREQIQRLILEKEGEILEFEQTDSIPVWQMKQPEEIPASEAALEFLVNLLVQGKVRSVINSNPETLQEYGLTKPFATLKIMLNNEQEHQLILGKNSFDDQSIYAQNSFPLETDKDVEVLLLPIDFRYAVERDFEEWKQEEIEESDSSDETNDSDSLEKENSENNDSDSPEKEDSETDE